MGGRQPASPISSFETSCECVASTVLSIAPADSIGSPSGVLSRKGRPRWIPRIESAFVNRQQLVLLPGPHVLKRVPTNYLRPNHMFYATSTGITTMSLFSVVWRPSTPPTYWMADYVCPKCEFLKEEDYKTGQKPGLSTLKLEFVKTRAFSKIFFSGGMWLGLCMARAGSLVLSIVWRSRTPH